MFLSYRLFLDDQISALMQSPETALSAHSEEHEVF